VLLGSGQACAQFCGVVFQRSQSSTISNRDKWMHKCTFSKGSHLAPQASLQASTNLFVHAWNDGLALGTNQGGSHNARCSHISETSAAPCLCRLRGMAISAAILSSFDPSKAGDPITRGSLVVVVICMRARRKQDPRGKIWASSSDAWSRSGKCQKAARECSHSSAEQAQ